MTSPAADDLFADVVFGADGLVPVIAQDLDSGVVRMFAWANRQALELTVQTGHGHFWSRSRQALWRKGESSGNVLEVRELRIDCDGDVVLYVMSANGPSCHTGHTSCFFRSLATSAPVGPARTATGTPSAPTLWADDDGPAEPPALIVKRVAETIARRKRERPEKSYVVSLLDAEWSKVLGKITEESGELIASLPEDDAPHTAHEAADLLFHMLVGLEKAGVPVDDVFAQLRRRFGVSGLEEKANRAKATAALASDALATAASGARPDQASPRK